MNDLSRFCIGVAGTLTGWGWGLDAFAKGAAIVASLATAAFMTVSTVEKLRNRRQK